MKLNMDSLYQSTMRLLVPLTVEKSYKVIIEEAKNLVGADFGSIFLVSGKNLKKEYSTVPKGYQGTPRKKGFTYQALTTQKPIVVNHKEFSNIHPKFTKSKVKCVVIIPLSYDNKVIGVVSLWSTKNRHFSSVQLKRLALFGAVAYLTIRNNQMYSQIQHALQLRDLFIGMAAHELRTPLTSVSGYAQILNQKLKKEKSPHVELVEKLRSRVTRMTELISDLLQVEHIKKGTFSYNVTDVDIYDQLKTVMVELKFKYPKHKVVLEPKDPGFKTLVHGDRTKLYQVFTNILDNAAKFTNPEYPLQVKIRPSTKFLHLRFIDKGLGINPKEIKRVFEGFYKSAEHTKKGMGLGLYVSKTIIEDHNGKIAIQSKKGVGTTVSIRLPKVL